MNNWESVSFFFTNICDITTFLQVTCFSLICIILDWPSKKGYEAILIQVLKYAIIFGLYFVVLSVFYGLDRIGPKVLSSFIFSLSF